MYANMKKIYNKANMAVYSMAVAYLLDKGFTFVQQITDEDVAELEGNGLMTKEYVQLLVNTAREIARECGNDVVELIQFCQAEEVFDTEWYKGDDDDVDV